MQRKYLTWGRHYNFHFTDEKTRPRQGKYLISISQLVTGKTMTSTQVTVLSKPPLHHHLLCPTTLLPAPCPNSAWLHICIVGYILGSTCDFPAASPLPPSLEWTATPPWPLSCLHLLRETPWPALTVLLTFCLLSLSHFLTIRLSETNTPEQKGRGWHSWRTHLEEGKLSLTSERASEILTSIFFILTPLLCMSNFLRNLICYTLSFTP